jgi:hypothetical protein
MVLGCTNLEMETRTRESSRMMHFMVCCEKIAANCSRKRYKQSTRIEPIDTGVCKFASGMLYSGDYVLGVREGKGVLTKPSGEKYEGFRYNGRLADRVGQVTFVET